MSVRRLQISLKTAPAMTVRRIALEHERLVYVSPLGGFASEEEEAELQKLSAWAEQRGLSSGVVGYELADAESGQQQAVLDLAWPEGVRQELTEPVAVLVNEGAEMLALANAAGFRCFTSIEAFRQYAQGADIGATGVVVSAEAVPA